jgi:hypothetical protein
MLKWFKCPKGSTVPIVEVKDCLSQATDPDKCPNGDRCMTLECLSIIAQEREWHGVASTTQLINGTMLEFLKLTRDYAIDPQSRAWILIGLAHHAQVEAQAKKLGLIAEQALSVDRDIIDSLKPNSEGWTITDNKTWGSYRVARALGLVEIGKQPDPSGAVYRSSGKWGKAGSPKMISVFRSMPQEVDMREIELQLNNYRVKCKDLGINVTRLQAQIVVRDGGLASASQRGIDRNMYKIPVKMLDDNFIRNYFGQKQSALLDALEQYKQNSAYLPQPCSDIESWSGRRCSEYCDVNLHCPKGALTIKQESE